MATHEPKCVQWKRRGAEKIAAQLAGLSPEQELKFWQEQTQRLKLLQAEARQRHRQPAGT
ncbi:MAG: hypothetical protein EA420_17680 [Candidatus Competibacteraceae bacterium]|nr:MAG: hypothetical protein EA420_17680 [Candidatus Competibacteraceae bacterium]